MDNAKIDNELNLALDVPEAERAKAVNLNVGYTPDTDLWELIVKYSGSLDRIREELQISAVELASQYAILTIPEYLIGRLSDYEEIEYIEKPKRLFYEVNEGRSASCINPVQTGNFNLFGEGVLVAIIDSGIDYSHPDFRNEDGTTRIEAIWDQTIQGSPPEGYDIGTLYTRAQINEALLIPMPERLEIVPSTDLSGHGTHVRCLKNILETGCSPLSFITSSKRDEIIHISDIYLQMEIYVIYLRYTRFIYNIHMVFLTFIEVFAFTNA